MTSLCGPPQLLRAKVLGAKACLRGVSAGLLLLSWDLWTECFLEAKQSELERRASGSQWAVSRLQKQSLQAQAGVHRDEGLVKPAGQVDHAQV